MMLPNVAKQTCRLRAKLLAQPVSQSLIWVSWQHQTKTQGSKKDKKGFRPMVSQGSLDSKAPHLLASWHESCSVEFASLLLPARFSKCLLPACQLVLYFEVCGICFYYSLWNLFIEFSSPGMRRIGRHWKEICIWDQSRPAKTNQCRSPRALVPAVAASKGGDQRNLISSTPSTCHNFKGSERKAVSVEFRRNLFIVATARHLLNLLM